MSAKENNSFAAAGRWIMAGIPLLLLIGSTGQGQAVRSLVNSGNRHYQAEDFSAALNQYEQALTENPRAYTARFNQGNVFYRLDDLEQAIKAYREVAAETKDMALVAKAKYNLGNTHFQQGLKQQDGDLQKALEAMRDSITQWRSVLELDPDNIQAARNIEVARLKIKDILDQINKQQQDPNQPQDPNQGQQQDPQQQGDGQQQPDQAGQDPNQPQPQDPNEGQDPNQPPETPEPEQQESEPPEQDMTAQAILDKEQRQKEQRRQQRIMRRRPVDKDW